MLLAWAREQATPTLNKAASTGKNFCDMMVFMILAPSEN
jgi:hypothetical protein